MKKFTERAVVMSQAQLGTGIFSLVLIAPQIASVAVPGQFVSVYSNDAARMLPRPISLCEVDAEGGTLRLVYRVVGKGTDEFSKMQPGDGVDLIGPLGNGFPLDSADENTTSFLIGGGIGVPPMVELSRQLKGKKIAVMGYRDEHTFLTEELKANAELVIATEDGSLGTKGNVLDAIRENGLKADVIYACGPMPMLRALKKYAEETGTLCYLSLEERMACGIGACLGCVAKTVKKDDHSKVNNTRVCTEGPVFDARDVEI